jgi:hypothetical protein
VDAWALERKSYNYKDPSFSEKTGHFTQVVWKATTSVGCGRKACNGTGNVSGWYIVCEYYPPGNVIGEFGTEVGKQDKGSSSGDVEEGLGSGAGRLRGVGAGVGVGAFVVLVAMLLA